MLLASTSRYLDSSIATLLFFIARKDQYLHIMSEMGGITELQLLEAEVASLEKQLSGVQGGEKTSTACARIVASIKGRESKDGFIQKEGVVEHNQFHTSAGTGGGGGCCVVQ